MAHAESCEGYDRVAGSPARSCASGKRGSSLMPRKIEPSERAQPECLTKNPAAGRSGASETSEEGN